MDNGHKVSFKSFHKYWINPVKILLYKKSLLNTYEPFPPMIYWPFASLRVLMLPGTVYRLGQLALKGQLISKANFKLFI